MATETTNIFNAIATPSAAMWRELFFHAATGNEAVASAFASWEGTRTGPRAEEERERREEFRSQMWTQMIRASQERIERFHVEMRELDERRVRLLERIDEQIRLTEEKLQRLRDAAPEIEFPDGTRRKVFRDFDQVRDESGALVSSDVMKAEDVSADPLNWNTFSSTKEIENKLVTQRQRLDQLGSDMAKARHQAKDGKMSDADMDEFKAETERRMAEEERLLNNFPRPEPVTRDRTFQSKAMPVRDFKGAASPAPQDTARPDADDFKPQGPAALMPAPM